MAQYETVPEYVAATPQGVVAARKQLTELRANPAFAMMQGARRAAVQAKFNSAMPLTAIEYVEFADVVPPGFSIRRAEGSGRLRAEQDEQRRKAQAEFAQLERKRRETPHPMTQQEAQALLGVAGYNEWVSRNQDVIARTVI
jgi:hypothetical protein